MASEYDKKEDRMTRQDHSSNAASPAPFPWGVGRRDPHYGSDTFYYEATNGISDTFLLEATGERSLLKNSQFP